jgi:predicted flap endonuclease-1-like 5' DNA nuclease
MLQAFRVHDAAVAAMAERRTAAQEAKAEKQRQAAERKAARLATQPADPALRRSQGAMRINRRALRRLNGLGSDTDAYLAWLDKQKNLDSRLIGKG